MEENQTTTEEKITEENELTVYELGYHLLPTIVDDETAKEVVEIKSVLEKQGAVFIAEEAPKTTTLAYTIVRTEGGKRHKFNSAYFGWVKFEMSAENISEIEKTFRANENILRFILIKTVKESTLMPKRIFLEKTKTPATHLTKPVMKASVKKEIQADPISKKELDEKIEELVVE